jgi:hypothetical protein
MKIAPGIHRIGGNSMINAYLIEQAGEVTIIDAGVSGFYKDIDKELAAMGRTPADPAKVVRAPSAFRPAWGGPNCEVSTCPRFVALVGRALSVFLQRIQAEVQ